MITKQFCRIFDDSYFTGHLLMASSECWTKQVFDNLQEFLGKYPRKSRNRNFTGNSNFTGNFNMELFKIIFHVLKTCFSERPWIKVFEG